MEDKLVTLAIHTYEKAQILKTILETEGIEVYIHNVNQIQPIISAGVRVRIKESDLPHALRIIEDSLWLSEEKEQEGSVSQSREKRILIPVDFSDYSIKACEIGINYANRIEAQVMFLHVYFAPYIPSTIPLGDTLTYQEGEETVQSVLKHATADMEAFCAAIDKKMQSGELPKVEYHYELREGLPEEEIIGFCREYHPSLIVMGTRGKSQKDFDLIGSVTGEVIEVNRVPVLAIPEDVPFDDFTNVKEIAFATSFNRRDLLAFDEFMGIIKPYGDVHIHLFNISTSRDEWNEIRLAGINDYFKRQYPEAQITHTVLADGDLLLAVEKFVREEQIDVIALSTYRRNVLARMFNPSIARKMLFHTHTPLLVMHANK